MKTVLFVTLAALAVSFVKCSILGEFCLGETFHATCPSDQVIVITQAQYGRPTLGRCVKENFGIMGCVADVGQYMEMQCGGRSTCDVTVADISLQDWQQCPDNVTSFLVVAYQCVKERKLPEESTGKDLPVATI
jgi:hypothetical protein